MSEGEKEGEEKVRSRMRDIDQQIRELHLERNRLKYFLRKDKDVNDSQGVDNLSTK